MTEIGINSHLPLSSIVCIKPPVAEPASELAIPPLISGNTFPRELLGKLIGKPGYFAAGSALLRSGLEPVVVGVRDAESDAVIQPTRGVVVVHDLQVQLLGAACRGPTGADVQDRGGDTLPPICS